MKENKRKIRRNIYIGISAIVAAIIFAMVYLIVTMPTPEEDIYFQMYEYRKEQNITIMYKYDAETQTVSEIGRVSGYFHNAEIDSEKKYITGVKSTYFSYKDTSDDDYGIVRFSLEDGTSELLVTAEQMRNQKEGDINWDYTFPFDNGKQVCIDYSSGCNLYDIETGTRKKIFKPYNSHSQAKNGNYIWYNARSGIKRSETTSSGRENITSKSVAGFTVSNDGEKIAFFGNKDIGQQVYLLDLASKKQKRILKAGWNCSFQWYGLQSSSLDKSGKYYYYIEHFHRLFSGSHVMIKVYDIQTKRIKCIYLRRDAPGTYEFIRTAS